MSEFVFQHSPAGPDASQDRFKEFRDRWPVLAAVMLGRTKSHPAGAAPPASIILFVDSGSLKFCVSPKTGPGVAFGVVDDPTELVESIVDSIASGRLEWKDRK